MLRFCCGVSMILLQSRLRPLHAVHKRRGLLERSHVRYRPLSSHCRECASASSPALAANEMFNRHARLHANDTLNSLCHGSHLTGSYHEGSLWSRKWLACLQRSQMPCTHAEPVMSQPSLLLCENTWPCSTTNQPRAARWLMLCGLNGPSSSRVGYQQRSPLTPALIAAAAALATDKTAHPDRHRRERCGRHRLLCCNECCAASSRGIRHSRRRGKWAHHSRLIRVRSTARAAFAGSNHPGPETATSLAAFADALSLVASCWRWHRRACCMPCHSILRPGNLLLGLVLGHPAYDLDPDRTPASPRLQQGASRVASPTVKSTIGMPDQLPLGHGS